MSQLREYQVPHVERLLAILRERRVAHDGSDCGCGKTFCAAAIAAELKLETLVICPLSVVAVWEKVLRDFGVTATVTNYEKAHRHFGTLKPWGSGSFFQFSKVWPLIVFDEAHRTSGDTTINSKMLIAAKRQHGCVLTLSATAVSTLLKMRGLGFVLGLHQLTDYRMWLFARGVRETEIKLRSGRVVKKLTITKERDAEAMARLHEEIFGGGNRGSRMRIADIPDFPKTQIEVRLLADTPASVARLSDELQSFYRQRNVLGAYSEDELAKLVFYRQASETAKIPSAIDMTEDAMETSKVAIFVNFSKTMDELLAQADKRGWKTGFVRGDQKPSDRQAFITAFQANKLDLIVCNLAAGGVGLSLHDEVTQYPRTSIIFPSWRAEDLKQAWGRPRRDGGGPSRQFVVYWGHGVEARIAASVERKMNNLSLMNDNDLDPAFDSSLAAKTQSFIESTATEQRMLL